MSKFIQGITNYDEWRDHAKDNAKYIERMRIISELLAKQDKDGKLSLADYYLLASIIQVSKLTGKLEDYYAVSTSVLMNELCQKRARIPGSICEKCYAAEGAQRFSGLCQCLETNHIILNNFLFPEEALATIAIPSTNGDARVEAHGDAATQICGINHTRIIRSHKHLDFALFTKNNWLYDPVFDAEGKPENMNYIISSPTINKVMEIPETSKKYVDIVFTVVTPEYAKENNIEINCGTWEVTALDHRCWKCRRCYLPINEKRPLYVYELLK